MITPPLGLFLSGYGFRDRGADEVLDDLEARVFWLQVGDGERVGESACIITADIIGFGKALTAALRSQLSERFGLPPERITLSASHTHSGPQTCENMTTAGGVPDPAYMASLQERLVEAVAQARADLRPVTLRSGFGSLSGYAINRRVLVNGKAVAAPNPKGVRDDQVTTLLFQDATSGDVRAALYHYTCHPTTMGSYSITGDFPGAARRTLEKEFQGAACGFLPGCFGDIRPSCTVVGGKRFRRGTPQDVQAFGSALGEEVARVAYSIADSDAALHQPHLAGVRTDLELPLVDGSSAELSLQRLDLAEDLALIAMGGEVCVDYGHWIKAMRPGKTTVPVGYSNGLVGYISSERMFPEGGYEPDTAIRPYNLPAPFEPRIEGMVLDAVKRMLA